MPSYSKYDVILVRYPFSDLSAHKVRPALIINASHPSQDFIVIPLTSRLEALLPGEFILQDWSSAGLNVPTAVKRGVYTVHPTLIVKLIGSLATQDAQQLTHSLHEWLGL